MRIVRMDGTPNLFNRSNVRLEGGNGAEEEMSSSSLSLLRVLALGPRFAAELLARRGLQCISFQVQKIQEGY